jgi:ferric-chelate reductase
VLVVVVIKCRHGILLLPTVVVWALDRILRLVRVALNSRGTNATIQLLGNDTVLLTVRRDMHWKPGQYAYITVPSVSKFPLEAHPFTISNTSDLKSDINALAFLIRQRGGFTKRLVEKARFPFETVGVFIDGPYGSPPDPTQFTTCILIAGGAGISYTLPLLKELVE